MASLQFHEIIFGILLLVFGKKLFWLSVGIIGFITVMDLAPRLFTGYSEFFVFILAVALGLIGAFMAVAFQWVTIITAGFLGAGYLFFYLFSESYLAFFIGGVIGALLMVGVFDWALILVSSLVGAALISQNLPFTDTIRLGATIALAAAGFAIQTAIFLGVPK